MTASQLTITPTPPTAIKVAAGQKGSFSFTVTSLAAPDKVHELIVQAQLIRDDGKGSEVDWLVAGPQRNQTLAGGKTMTITITVHPTASTPHSVHRLKLVVASEAAPDDDYVDSAPVVCEVTEGAAGGDKPKARPNWLLIAAIVGGAVLLVGGGLVLWRVLRHKEPPLPGLGEVCNATGACDKDLVCATGRCLLAGGAACKPEQAALCVSGECTAAGVCALPSGATCSPDGTPCAKALICDPGTKTCRSLDPCGDRGLKCCSEATPCNGRNICGSGGLCVECGERGDKCCSGATPCSGTDLCNTAGVCAECGIRGGACCAGPNPCTAGNLCSGNLCTECGTRGNRCCPGATPCSGTDLCNTAGFCGACGVRGGPCCIGPNPCSAGNLCGSGNICAECGTLGNRCCPGANPCSVGTICGGNGLCTACGGIGQPCCNGSTCNGVAACINQSCHFYEVGTSEQSIPGGGGNGGGPYTIRCNAGEIAIGFHGRFGTEVDAAGVVCAVINKNGSIGTAHNSGAAGGGGGSPFNVQCPPGFVLTGAAGRSGSLTDAIIGHCSTVARAAGNENSGTRDIGPFGGGGGAPFDRSCPANQVIAGITGRSGTLVDQINFLCRPLIFH